MLSQLYARKLYAAKPVSGSPKLPRTKRKGFSKSRVQILPKADFDTFLRILSPAVVCEQKDIWIVTRVGFEPTPFRTSVLEEP